MKETTAGAWPTVSVVVPTYRRPDVLHRTVSALLGLDYPADRFELIIVDDGSCDTTRDVVTALQSTSSAKLVYVEQENAGAATARNRGARLAKGEMLIFVDDDIVVEPSHIRDHLTAHDERGSLVNGHWEFPEGLTQTLEATPFGRFRLGVEQWVKTGISKERIDEHREEPSAVTACNLSLRRDLFWTLGGFDEEFPFAGYEDQDLSYRAVQAGCRLLYDRRIRLVHNDQRLSLLQFCERQRRGACTAVYLAKRHPGEFGGRDIITENGPVTRLDTPPTVLRKLAKRALTLGPGLRAAHAGVSALERLAPASQLLQRAYWSTCGLYIFLGVRDGFAATRPTGGTSAGAGVPCR